MYGAHGLSHFLIIFKSGLAGPPPSLPQTRFYPGSIQEPKIMIQPIVVLSQVTWIPVVPADVSTVGALRIPDETEKLISDQIVFTIRIDVQNN